MNEFTKAELMSLLYRSYAWVSYPENQNAYESQLINKIRSLIDNYCEHGYMTGKRGVITCDDCGKCI